MATYKKVSDYEVTETPNDDDLVPSIVVNPDGSKRNRLFPYALLKGPAGTNGQGVPTGGTTNQVLQKASNANYDTQWTTMTLNKAAVGLSNVDNTSDADKPVSTAQQTALDSKANTAHTHNASEIDSGTVSPARLGTANPLGLESFLASNSTYKTMTGGVFFSATHSGSQTIAANAFNTIAHNTVLNNIGGGTWSGNLYTVPVTGIYYILSSVRLNDGSGSRSAGQAVHTSNVDGNWFYWQQWGAQRYGNQYTRLAVFNAGDKLRHYLYSEGSSAAINSSGHSLTIMLIKEL